MSQEVKALERRTATPFWRDERVLKVVAQALFAAAALGLLTWMILNYRQTGLKFSYGFLDEEASFDLAEGISFDPTDTYARAFLVGVLNTLRVAVLGIILSTILGLIAGVARLSNNWLVRGIASVYIAIVRNTPLLVQLFFLYFAVIMKLPQLKDSIRVPGYIVLSNRGMSLLWFRLTDASRWWWPFLVVTVIVVAGLYILRRRSIPQTGRPAFSFWWMGLALIAIPTLGWLVIPGNPLRADRPELTSTATGVLRVQGGTALSSEYAALLIGLVIYTGAFIAEVVRAGLQAVPKGQTEAARAQGFTQGQVLRLIVIPQALRVIIPPLISQYLNLTKNSSLAIGIGFLDLYAVSSTMLNQSGRVVEVFLMIMGAYLAMSLSISLLMNYVNRRTQIVER